MVVRRGWCWWLALISSCALLAACASEDGSEDAKQDQGAATEPDPPAIDESILRQRSCVGCHSKDRKLVGPTFTEIAQRYGRSGTPRESTVQQLATRIRKGSSGRWSSLPMPPNQAV